jgi:predicted GNAT superfamily acetyltransferase
VQSEIEIRECTKLDELGACVALQREVFALPEIEISPVRHFVVTNSAGGFTLGAFSGGELVGFVLSVPAFLRGEKAFYSHMTAVKASSQGTGVGAKLKWSQRTQALRRGVKFIKWTFEPVKARNAHFNLEKLGAIVTEYEENFYGTDYSTSPDAKIGLASDRLFAEWHLDCDKVVKLAAGESYSETRNAAALIVVPSDWSALVARDAQAALATQLTIREEFQTAFGAGMIGAGFVRDRDRPYYVLYRK